MRRLFWLVMGITIGALIVRKLSSAAQKATPSGIGATLSDMGATMRDFAREVRAAMGERETQLRADAGLDTADDPATDDTTTDDTTTDETRRGGAATAEAGGTP